MTTFSASVSATGIPLAISLISSSGVVLRLTSPIVIVGCESTASAVGARPTFSALSPGRAPPGRTISVTRWSWEKASRLVLGVVRDGDFDEGRGWGIASRGWLGGACEVRW